jgi:hypothetical protein
LAFVENSNGTLFPNEINFSSVLSNILDTQTSWSTSPSVFLTFEGSGQRSLSRGNFGNNDKVTVTLSGLGVSDSITVYRVKDGTEGPKGDDGTDGENAYTVFQSNSAHTFPADADGTITDFSGGDTTILAFYGATQLNYDRFFAAAGEFEIQSITNGPGVSGTTNASDDNGGTLPAITGMSNDTGYRDIEVIVNGSNDVASQTFTIRQTFSKSKGGESGERGAGRWYIPTSSNGAGSLPTSSTAVQQLWDAELSFQERPRDQVIIYRGSLTNQTSQGAWIRNETNTTWIEQDELIDGNLLVTGTVTGGALVANTITGDLLAGTSIITNSAQFDDAVITGAKIGDLEVDTLQIAGNAITVPTSSYAGSTAVLISAGNTLTIGSLAVTREGGKALITFNFVIRGSTSQGDIEYSLDVDRGSTNLRRVNTQIIRQGDWYMQTIVAEDTPRTGTYTYSLKLENKDATATVTTFYCAISILETKK